MTATIWVVACRQGEEAEARATPRSPGRTGRVLWIPPPFAEIALVHGVWRRLNARLGTLFDTFEQENLGPDSVEAFACAVEEEVGRLRGVAENGSLRAQIAVRIAPTRADEYAEMTLAEMERGGGEFVRFAREVAREGIGLVVGM